MQSTPVQTLIAGVHAGLRDTHTLPPGRERFGFSDSEANSQTGGRQARESSRSGADDTASARHGTSAGCCAADTELSGFVSGGQHNPPLRTNTVTPRPTL